MVGLQSLTFILAKFKPELLVPDLVGKVVAGIAQQAVEKIDRTRAVAGKIFYSFLHRYEKLKTFSNCHFTFLSFY